MVVPLRSSPSLAETWIESPAISELRGWRQRMARWLDQSRYDCSLNRRARYLPPSKEALATRLLRVGKHCLDARTI